MASSSKKALSIEEWSRFVNEGSIRRTDINKLLMNFLVTEGYAKAAEKFQMESGTKPALEIPAIRERMAVIRCVQHGNIDVAIKRIQRLCPQILDANPEPLHSLQRQQFIELIRNGKAHEALFFAQQKPHLGEIQKFLLGYGEVMNSPHAHLMDESYRMKLAREVNEAILTAQKQEKKSDLWRLLKMMSYMQRKLDEVAVYPRAVDFSTAKFDLPPLDPDATMEESE